MTSEYNRRRARQRRRTIAARQSYSPRGDGGGGRWSGLLVLGVLVALGLIYVLFLSPVFAVKNIDVQGAGSEAREVREAARDALDSRYGAFSSQSLIILDTSRVVSAVKEKVPSVASVTVRKKWLNSLQIDVTERKVGLIWKSGSNRYLVDQNGVAYESTDRADALLVEDLANLPVTVGKPVVGTGFIKAILRIQQGMAKGKLPIVKFRVPETTFEVQAITEQGWYALFDTTRPVGSQVSAVIQAVASGKPYQYADARVPGRVYIK